MKAIIHGKDDNVALKVLSKCREAMMKESKLLIIDPVIHQDESYQDACVNDINMLSVSNGKDRTLEKFEILLSQTGFSLIATYPVLESLKIIEAEL